MDPQKRPTEEHAHSVSSEFFVGRLAPFWMLDYQLQGLFSVVEPARVSAEANPLFGDILRRATEAALVASVGFFEAFCKHQFAALLTLFPPLLADFAGKRPESTIRLSSLAQAPGGIDKTIGFLIAEEYDFGSARIVNGLFRDLLLVTPFAKDEIEKLDAILRKRHLIVHHGGIHTMASIRESPATTPRPFLDVVTVDADEYFSINDVLAELGAKLAIATVEGLRRKTHELADLDSDRRSTVQLLLRGVWDDIA